MFMKNVFLSLTTAAILFGCKKSSPAPIDNCGVNNSNIAGIYTISDIKYKSSSNASETDLFTGLPDCQKDDTYELKADGTVIIGDGATDCNLPPMPGLPSNWRLESDNSVLVMGTNLHIISFNCTKLIVQETNIMVDGDIKTTTYEKK